MKLTQTSSVAVYDSLRERKNPHSHYSLTISGYLIIGNFVYLAPSTGVTDDDGTSIHSKMLMQFRSSKTFGQVTHLYNSKSQDPLADEDDVLLEINLYLKRDAPPSILGRFISRVPPERMLVQTDLAIEGCTMKEIVGTVLVDHMDRYDWLTEGLLNVFFLDSVYHPAACKLKCRVAASHPHTI
jgi:hypothetical protein